MLSSKPVSSSHRRHTDPPVCAVFAAYLCKIAFCRGPRKDSEQPRALCAGGKHSEQVVPQGGREKSVRGDREAGVAWSSGPRTWNYGGELHWFQSQETELDDKISKRARALGPGELLCQRPEVEGGRWTQVEGDRKWTSQGAAVRSGCRHLNWV